MRSSLFLSVALVLMCGFSFGTIPGTWQPGRIVEIQKSIDSKPLYWIANTPVTRDETTYKITVHLGQRLIIGIYTVDRLHEAPPDEWVRGRPVKVQLEGQDMYLKPLSGNDIKLRIVKRKPTSAMQPVTNNEMKEAYAPPESLASSTDPETKKADPEPEHPAEQSERADPPKVSQTGETTSAQVGVVDVSTVPYLAEIYLDGASLGYSPAKFTLPAGKHVLRLQKDGYQTWSKEVNVLQNSEFTVYAELKKKNSARADAPFRKLSR